MSVELLLAIMFSGLAVATGLVFGLVAGARHISLSIVQAAEVASRRPMELDVKAAADKYMESFKKDLGAILGHSEVLDAQHWATIELLLARLRMVPHYECGTIESFRRLGKDEVYPTLPYGWQTNFTKSARNTDIG
jgi:hypothetical protein